VVRVVGRVVEGVKRLYHNNIFLRLETGERWADNVSYLLSLKIGGR